jgi:hypothetical protein
MVDNDDARVMNAEPAMAATAATAATATAVTATEPMDPKAESGSSISRRVERDMWVPWIEAMGDPPAPFVYQTDQYRYGFPTRALNADGPLRGNMIPYSQPQKVLSTRNVTTLHWPGLLNSAAKNRGAGSISLDSGVDVARFLGRFGITAAKHKLLAPLQMSRKGTPGSRGLGTIRPRCDFDYKCTIPYEEAKALVRQDTTQCLIDLDAMRSYHFSTQQLKHHAQVVGRVVARLFHVEPREINVAILRAPIPAMDLVLSSDGTILPRRSRVEKTSDGKDEYHGDVVVKPSYWMIFNHIQDLKPTPLVQSPTPTVSDYDLNIARLFHLDDLSHEPLVPSLRLAHGMEGYFYDCIHSALLVDKEAHPDMYRIKGHDIPLEKVLDRPYGQRLARSTKSHDCIYHETVHCDGHTQRVVGLASHCPFSSISHACCKRGPRGITPVPPVRFHEPEGRIVDADIPLLRSKAMSIILMYNADGSRFYGDAVLRGPWGPVFEQAWTCPYVTTQVAEASASIPQGLHLDETQLLRDGIFQPNRARVRSEEALWAYARRLAKKGLLVHRERLDAEDAIALAARFKVLDTTPSTRDRFKDGYVYTPMRLGVGTVAIGLLKEEEAERFDTILLIPNDDGSTGTHSLYCRSLLETNYATMNALYQQDPENTGNLKKVFTRGTDQCGLVGLPDDVVHQHCYHKGCTPVYFTIQPKGAHYVMTRCCMECNKTDKNQYNDTIMDTTGSVAAMFDRNRPRKRKRRSGTKRRKKSKIDLIPSMPRV